jgi:hypothetical protein
MGFNAGSDQGFIRPRLEPPSGADRPGGTLGRYRVVPGSPGRLSVQDGYPRSAPIRSYKRPLRARAREAADRRSLAPCTREVRSPGQTSRARMYTTCASKVPRHPVYLVRPPVSADGGGGPLRSQCDFGFGRCGERRTPSGLKAAEIPTVRKQCRSTRQPPGCSWHQGRVRSSIAVEAPANARLGYYVVWSEGL